MKLLTYMVLAWRLATFTSLEIKQTPNNNTILLDQHTSKQSTSSKLSASILYHRYPQTATYKLTRTCLQMFTRQNVVFAAYNRDKTAILHKLTWPVLRAWHWPCLPFFSCKKSMLSLTSEITACTQSLLSAMFTFLFL